LQKQLQQQLQQQQSRDTGGVVRQVAVGIITLEDVIEELMQVGDMLLQ
jgi:CBS domain containing-hemolysin-like protein